MQMGKTQFDLLREHISLSCCLLLQIARDVLADGSKVDCSSPEKVLNKLSTLIRAESIVRQVRRRFRGLIV